MFGGIAMTINPWVLLIALAVFVSSCLGCYWYGNSVGKDVERVKWEKRENKELAAANKKIIDLTEKARADESLHAVKLASISAQYQEDLKNVKDKAARVISDVRAGTLKLRIPVTERACTSEGSKVEASTERRDGEARAELSKEASEFLIGLTGEADEVVEQLQACQRIVEEDRRTCGSKP
jgi:prophage endopeptidase